MTSMFVNRRWPTWSARRRSTPRSDSSVSNQAMSDHNTACIVVEQDHSFFMLFDPRLLPELQRPADR